jgi:hypothetical protein
MKLAFLTCIATFIIPCVLASPIAMRQQYPACQPGTQSSPYVHASLIYTIALDADKSQLFAPEEITPDRPFRVKYCPVVPQRGVTHEFSNNIILAIASQQGVFQNSKIIAQRRENEGYEFETVLPFLRGAEENSYFQVLDVQQAFLLKVRSPTPL